jgi:hypothetical protein
MIRRVNDGVRVLFLLLSLSSDMVGLVLFISLPTYSSHVPYLHNASSTQA